tara:strand:- start:2908 stop:3108 length:201 start_codon:yes stop_codon:yes gene_type:complete
MNETQKAKIIKALKDEKHVCNKNKEFPNLRKIVFAINQKEEMHIHSMTCQCNDSNKHKQYYYEWAL